MINRKFKHSCTTTYHCVNCKDKFKFKKENYKKNKKIPKCDLCNQHHWRCLRKKCDQCCELNKCNDINCTYCIENGLECKRTFPRSNEEFEKIYKERGLTYFSGKFERSETGRLHAQLYFQTRNRVTLKQVKEIFGDRSMSLPNYLVKDSGYNKDYSLKKFYRCKEHIGCKCDYMDITKICELCDINCIRSLAVLSGIKYDVGLWEFGNYRFMKKRIKLKKLMKLN